MDSSVFCTYPEQGVRMFFYMPMQCLFNKFAMPQRIWDESNVILFAPIAHAPEAYSEASCWRRLDAILINKANYSFSQVQAVGHNDTIHTIL